jgi:hypothetical protein
MRETHTLSIGTRAPTAPAHAWSLRSSVEKAHADAPRSDAFAINDRNGAGIGCSVRAGAASSNGFPCDGLGAACGAGGG